MNEPIRVSVVTETNPGIDLRIAEWLLCQLYVGSLIIFLAIILVKWCGLDPPQPPPEDRRPDLNFVEPPTTEKGD